MATNLRQLVSFKHPFYKSKRVWFVIVLLAILLIVVLELTNTAHLFHHPSTASGSIPTQEIPVAASKPTQKAGKAASSSATAPSAQVAQDKNSAPSTALAGGGKLVAPFGSFISNHHPGENGAPTTEVSVCNTSPGARCLIEFTHNDITKKLEAKTADSSGATYWDWDLKDAGFSQGSWTIKAIATYGSQTASSTDTQTLEVN